MKPCHDIHALRAAGATIAEISDLTGLPRSTVRKRLSQEIEPPRRKGSTERACMCCGKPFLSEGAHNRLCDACRHRSVSPYDIPAIVRYR